MKRINKLFQTNIKSIDEDKREITFCFSDDQVDRMGEIVDQSTWDTKSYMGNPLILWGHNPDEPENVLGSAVNMSLNAGGKSFVTARFDDDETNPKAGLVFRQLLKGTLRCVSAGFIPHTYEVENDVPVLKDNELLEISIVPIPANPRAVALALKEGSLSVKDARWLQQSMRKELEHIEATVKAVEHKEKDMTDEQAKALIDAVAKLTTAVEAGQAETAELKVQLAELKPAAETDAEKAAREATEAEAAKHAEEEAKKKEDDLAKSGDHDQDGAKEDEFDEDAELTPEQEAALDEQLQEQLAQADEHLAA